MAEDHMVSTTLEFPYRRSLGTTFGAFMTALAQHRILGARLVSGDVLVPPLEHDPATGDATSGDLVEVGPGGEVTSWAWVSEPSSRHPLDHPFAFALIKLDGASTAMVHAVDAGDIGAMHTGMRVVPRWADEPKGVITDIEAFIPEGGGA
ncbi:MAG: Zn-ribbon domain-containing OB-fold protein [Acidimicrobiales bacterium]